MSSSSSLVPNLSYPFQGFTGGGAFAQPPMQGNTLLNMFGPEADPIVPEAQLMNPFSGATHVRREVPDSATMVNLPEVVIFLMTTDGQNFMLEAVLPLVRWGWALRTITQRGLIFPRMPIPETPETAPYRTSIFGGFIETTNFTRFAAGTQYSMEYYKTAQGKNHQTYDLYRLSLSVSEMLNDRCYGALLGCKKQVAMRFASMGEFRSIDVRKALQQDVLHWNWVIKEEYGFQKQFEDVLRIVAKFQGSVTAAIVPSIVNSLILARPEMLKYYLAGPAGPGRVTDQNRSLIPQGQITIFTPRHTPERVGATIPPTMGGSQIGNYHKSLELPEVRSGSDEYLRAYDSYCRGIGLYCPERDRVVYIPPMELLDHCNLFGAAGKVRGLSGKGGRDTNDFLTLTQADVDDRFRSEPPEFPKPSPSGKQQRPPAASGRKKNMKGGPMKIFGQLRLAHFSATDRMETGRMLLFRLEERYPKMASAISAGLELYKNMCQAAPDLDFVDHVLRSNVATLYKKRWSSAEDGTLDLDVAEGRPVAPPAFARSMGWVRDPQATDDQELMERAHQALAEYDGVAGYAALINAEVDLSCPPLPIKKRLIHDTDFGKDHKFSNLTGYASYEGFRAMAKLWSSDPSSAESEYDAEVLKVGTEFVRALEAAAERLEELLPGFADGEVDIKKGESIPRMIAERGLGMCAIPLWMNSRKVGSVILSKDRLDKQKQFPSAFDYTDGKKVAEAIGEVSAVLLGRYFSSDDSSPSLLTEFVRVVGDRIKRTKAPYIEQKDKADSFARLKSIVEPTRKLDEEEVGTKISGLYKKKDFQNQEKRPTLGLRPNNPFWNLVFLWSPLRLAVFGALLELLIQATQLNDERFAIRLNQLTNLFSKTNDEQYAANLVFDELKNLYKGDTQFKTFSNRLSKAKKADDDFWKDAFVVEDATKPDQTGPFTVRSPLLSEISGKPIVLKVDGGAALLEGTTALLKQSVDGQDEFLLKLIGFNPRAGNLKQLPIGGKSKFKFDKADVSSNILGEIDAFWKTGLSISADQLEAFCGKNSPSESSSIFDLRAGDLEHPNRYVSYDRQPGLLKRMRDVQTSFGAHVSQMKQSPEGTHHIGLAVRWIDVPLLEVKRRLHHTFVGPTSGREGADEADQVAGLQSDVIHTEDFMKALSGVDALSPDPWTRCLSALWSITPFTRASCSAAVRHSIRLPFNFLIFRPHMNFLSHYCFFVKPGVDDLGFTAIAGEDVMEGGTHITKEGGLHASFWHAVHIRHPENEHTVFNFAPAGLGPGGSTGWIDPATYDPAAFGDFDEPTTPGSQSMMCVPIPFSENPTRDYIDIRGHMAIFELEDGSSMHVSDEDRVAHYPSWERANDAFKFSDHAGLRYIDTMGISGMYPKQNSLCWSGMTFYRVPKIPGVRDAIYMTVNKGQWGPNQGPGCGEIYRGRLTTALPNFNYNTDTRYFIVA